MRNILLALLLCLSSFAPAAVPTRVASHGPNGTHWPHRISTPFMYDTAANEVEVACTKAALAAALAAVTDMQANAGMRILVQPGALDLGTAALENLGSLAWTKRVVVCPRDGWGSVTWSGYINNVNNVCFAGFIGDNIVAVGCSGSALARCKLLVSISWNAASDCEFADCIFGTPGLDPNDVMQVYTSGADTARISFEGCYWPSHFFPAGGEGIYHTDGLQAAQVGGGAQFDWVVLDCACFSSNNAWFQLGNIDGVVFEHTYIAGGAVAEARYPRPVGASLEGGGSAFNGAGQNYEFYDCIIIGALSFGTGDSATPVKVVSNSRISYDPTATYDPTDSGAWTVDLEMTAEDPEMPPEPTYEFLAPLFSDPGDDEEEDPPATPRAAPHRTGFFFGLN